MPPHPSESLILSLARQFVLGILAGLGLLVICIMENVAGLAYLVLAGGPLTLLGLMAAFGCAIGFLTVAVSLFLHWHEQSVARMQLIPAPANRRHRSDNQKLQ